MTEAESKGPALKKPRRWTLLLVVVGTIAVYSSMMAANGCGWSPLVYLLLGAVGTPMLAAVLIRWWNRSKPARPWLMRVVAVLFLSMISFVSSKWSTRLDGDATFVRVFGVTPPAGFSNLIARQQWYDGRWLVVGFQCDAAPVEQLLKTLGGEERLEPRLDSLRLAVSVPQLDMSEIAPPLNKQWRYWEPLSPPPNTKLSGHVQVIWDRATKRGVAIAWE